MLTLTHYTHNSQDILYQFSRLDIQVRYLELYPQFKSWALKVERELLTPARSLLLVEDNKEIVAYSILKHTSDENKICLFQVSPHRRRQGIGTAMMERAISILNGTALITVNEQLVRLFIPLLTKFGFYLDIICDDLYYPGNREYFYRL